MSGVKTSHSMGGARADRAPSAVLQPVDNHLSYHTNHLVQAEHSRVATWQASSAPAPSSLHLPTRHHHRRRAFRQGTRTLRQVQVWKRGSGHRQDSGGRSSPHGRV
eukprot:scaffold4330_cov137-Isochrysis_galbana.AAC.2